MGNGSKKTSLPKGQEMMKAKMKMRKLSKSGMSDEEIGKTVAKDYKKKAKYGYIKKVMK